MLRSRGSTTSASDDCHGSSEPLPVKRLGGYVRLIFMADTGMCIEHWFNFTLG